tara:strand:- start:162 stop:383 length:222 start_codon:yes stop_codon:yes gene_type:complete
MTKVKFELEFDVSDEDMKNVGWHISQGIEGYDNLLSMEDKKLVIKSDLKTFIKQQNQKFYHDNFIKNFDISEK